MDARSNTPTDSSIGDLLKQLADDGRMLARAEIGLYKEIILYRAGKAKSGMIALIAGGLLAYAGLVAGLTGIVMGLAGAVGAVASGLIVFAITGTTGFLLIRYGTKKIATLFKNENGHESPATQEPQA